MLSMMDGRRALQLSLLLAVAVATSGGCSPSDDPTPAAGARVVVGLSPESLEVTPGASAAFAATVTGAAVTDVAWSVVEAGGGSVDANGTYVAPGSTGTFHVRVQPIADPTIFAIATVTVTTTPAVVEAAPIRVGMNLGWVSDWDPNQIFADMLKQGRAWGAVGSPSNGSTLVPLDADGWPTTDSEVLVLSSRTEGGYGGAYSLAFEANGDAAVARVAGVSVSLTRTGSTPPYRYTGTADVPSNVTSFTVAFTSTSGGVRNARLLRPNHGTGELFNRAFLSRLGTFGLLRPMETFGPGTTFDEAGLPHTVGVMGNPDTTWASRTTPNRSCLTLTGPAWEHLILLANQTQKDLWINIPYHATDEYITRLAQLFRYGSDGVNPYAAPQANPTYPPLAPNLKLYVEFANELWNSAYGFPNTAENQGAIATEIAGGDPFRLGSSSTGSGDTGRAWRRISALGVRQSLLFRRVFGSSEMMTRIRPVVGSQADRFAVTTEIFDYLSSTWGPSTAFTSVSTPAAMGGTVFSGAELGQPASYYFWALAVAPYVGFAAADANPTSLDAAFASLNAMQSGTGNVWGTSIFDMLDFAATSAQGAGIKLVTYEGGQDLHTNQPFADAAQADPRMRTLLVDLMHHFYALGPVADLFTYFTLAGDGLYGLSPDLTSETSQKWLAVKQVASGL